MTDTHCYVSQCINNSYVINKHLQARNSCVSRALDTFCVTSSRTHELKSKFYLFFFLHDTLAVRLLRSSFIFIFCKLQLSYLQIDFNAYA